MTRPCYYCNYPAVCDPATPAVCRECAARDAAADVMHEEGMRAPAGFDRSVHCPFSHSWLTSWELVFSFRMMAASMGVHRRSLLGGDVYELRFNADNWLYVWRSPSELIVSYPTVNELYPRAVPIDDGGESWEALVGHLRYSEPLPLGQARMYSSYGGVCARPGVDLPAVRWGQYGDWAAASRTWYHAAGYCGWGTRFGRLE